MRLGKVLDRKDTPNNVRVAIRKELFERKRIEEETTCKLSIEDRRIIELEILVIAEDIKDRVSGRN